MGLPSHISRHIRTMRKLERNDPVPLCDVMQVANMKEHVAFQSVCKETGLFGRDLIGLILSYCYYEMYWCTSCSRGWVFVFGTLCERCTLYELASFEEQECNKRWFAFYNEISNKITRYNDILYDNWHKTKSKKALAKASASKNCLSCKREIMVRWLKHAAYCGRECYKNRFGKGAPPKKCGRQKKREKMNKWKR
jgi:hypothetical protein